MEYTKEIKTKKTIPVLYERKEECCGCTACYAICPKSAISMVEDEEGFDYPQIDEIKCISCFQCTKVCPMGVNVNCVSPGFIQRGQFSENQLPYLLKSNFMNKVGCSEDIASAVAFLASNEADFITGQNLCVDGGRSLGLHGDN